MKISTEIASASKIVGEKRAIELIAKVGFEAWDFSMFAMCPYNWQSGQVEFSYHPLYGANAVAFAKELKKIGLDNGIVCNQSHAPFPISSKQILSRIKVAIECTAEAGGKICVVHPDNNKTAEQNAEVYFELLPFAKECGVKIATENMWNWNSEKNQASFAACSSPQDFNAHLDAVNDSNFVACLDVGHAEMRGLNTNAVEMILALKDRLQALHLHDNDLWHDSHQIPFSMQMDFNAIAKALKQINYQGDFTLEADRYLSAYNSENILEGLINLASSARKIVDIFSKN